MTRGRCSPGSRSSSLDWTEIELFQVDERVAPAGSDERNLTHLVESLSIGAQGSIRPMPVTDDDLEAAADRYAALAPGGDRPRPPWAWGPTGTPPRSSRTIRSSRSPTSAWPWTSGEYQGARRMTLTYPEIEARPQAALGDHRRGEGRRAEEADRPGPLDPVGASQARRRIVDPRRPSRRARR